MVSDGSSSLRKVPSVALMMPAPTRTTSGSAVGRFPFIGLSKSSVLTMAPTKPQGNHSSFRIAGRAGQQRDRITSKSPHRTQGDVAHDARDPELCIID